MDKTTPRFEITARDGRWVVSADGAMILACRRKRMAIEVARTAERLMQMHSTSHNDADGPETCGGSACAARALCDGTAIAPDEAYAGPVQRIRRAS